MPFKRNVFWHIEAIQRCLPAFEADARMNFQNMTLYVGARNRYHFMQPQFVLWIDGKLSYSPMIAPGTKGGFIGWLPYFNKRWPTGSSKLPFKDYCITNDIPTPKIWKTPEEADVPYVIKHFNSSFGAGVHGPFRPGAPVPQGKFTFGQAYAEAFVPGRMAKIWYWDAKPACLELFDMPTVTGNGKDNFHQLIERKGHSGGPAMSRDDMRALAAYQSLDLESVPDQGQVLLAEIRYGSSLSPQMQDNANQLRFHQSDAIGAQLTKYGEMFWKSIPEELRKDTLFTIDAILDAQHRLWFLEMNCNPTGHPDVYPVMFEGLFGPAKMPVAESFAAVPATNAQNMQGLMAFRPQTGIPDFSMRANAPNLDKMDGGPR